MIMDSRLAAELLYESEATLRMVGDVLDELHLGEIDAAARAQGLWAVGDGRQPGGDEDPSDLCVRGYWQVHELLECVRQIRQMMGPAQPQTELALGGSAGDEADPERLDRVLSIVDALESLDDPARPDRASMVAELRTEIRSILAEAGKPSGTDFRTRAALSLLSEAEARLTRLGHLFEGGENAA